MPESFGARLRQQRENRGIALSAITAQTGIKAGLLEALERDDLSQWPSGFYRRAFFRSYAAAIQLDPEVWLRDFQAVYPEPPERDVLVAMAQTLGLGERTGTSLALRGAVRSALDSLGRFRRRLDTSPSLPENQLTPPESPLQLEITEAVEHVPAPESEPEMQRHENPSPPEPKTSAVPITTDVDPPARPDAGPDLLDLAELCSDLGCVTGREQAQKLLHEVARMLDATGAIVWAWNGRESWLEPVLWHGYAPRVIAQLPTVRPDDDNATAVALRTVETQVVQDDPRSKAAIAIPLRTASGCVGVFAIELQRGLRPTRTHVAVATLVATQLAPIAEYLAQPDQLSFPQAVNGNVY